MFLAMEDPMSKTTAFAVAALSAVILAAGCRQPKEDAPSPSPLVFNVKDFGATGIKEDLAQEAIQKAVDACAAAGGGTVFIPPGHYPSASTRTPSSTAKTSSTSPSKAAASSTAKGPTTGVSRATTRTISSVRTRSRWRNSACR
jgi:hypothetical protein